MRVPASLLPLLVAGVLPACNETPSRPVGPAAIATPSFSTTVQGAPPPFVYLKALGGTCLNVGAFGQDAMSQTVTLHGESSLLVYFGYEWGSLNLDQEGVLNLTLDGQTPTPFAFGIAGNAISRTSGTVMWSFADVPAGTHTVAARARVDGGDRSAELNECALTVFVIPSPGQPG